MKREYRIGIGVAAVALAVALFFLLGPRRHAERPAEQDASAEGQKRPALLRQKGAAKSAVKSVLARQPAERGATNRMVRTGGPRYRGKIGGGDDEIFRDENGKPYPEKDQTLMRQARDAIDNDDLESARALAAEAASSTNDELREMAVEALSWFGKDTLVELTQYMADANEDIAEAAKDGWMGGLQEIDDDGEKAGIVETTMKTLRNADVLEDIANELVGIDELAAVQALANIIEDGKNAAAVAAAKEAYNSITDSAWKGVDAAEAWLQKNYVPDDDDDDGK